MTEAMKVGERGSEQVIEKWLGGRRKVTTDELRELVELAREHDGELVNVSAYGQERDPDDWCGTMWFRKPRPKVGSLIDVLLEKGWNVEVFPLGIPALTGVEVLVRNQIRR
jgi:hypothetical protein